MTRATSSTLRTGRCGGRRPVAPRGSGQASVRDVRLRLALAGALGLVMALLGARTSRAQDLERVTIEPPPSWLAPRASEPDREPEAVGGIAILSFDNQVRYAAGERWRYVAMAVRITSEVGLETAGERTFGFVPPHERLVVHRLDIRRDGAVISQLGADRIRVLERERGLERGTYDGARTAVVVLRDLRVGDVVVSEYSAVGSNPVLAGHLTESWELGAPQAIGSLRFRLLSDRPLFTRLFGGENGPTEERAGSFRELTWSARGVAGYHDETDRPPEYDLAPWVQMSDTTSWQEVERWGTALFELPTPLPAGVAAKAQELAAGLQPEAQVLAVLRMVQRDIRYLSLAFGESSHRPSPPAEVLERRYGDCKDKALLTVALLRAVGFEAHVALVSTQSGRRLAEFLPAVGLFDHAIVTVDVDDRSRWVDPTRAHQSGSLDEVAVRGLGHALVLGVSDRWLRPIDEPRTQDADVHARLRYRVGTFGDRVELDAQTTFVRGHAEMVRALHAGLGADEFARLMAAPIVAVHADARSIGEPVVSESAVLGRLTVAQRFELPDPWTRADGQVTIVLTPPYLANLLPAAAADRHLPLVLDHPLRVVHDVDVALPERITLETPGGTLGDRPFRFDWTAKQHDGHLVLHSDLAVNQRRVEVAGLEAYRTAVRELDRAAGFQISHGNVPASVPATGPPDLARSTALLGAAFWVAACLGAVVWLHRRKPWWPRPSIPYTPALDGRGGWLALLGLGVTVTPVVLVVQLVRTLPAYDPLTWNALTTPGSAVYRPAAAAVFTFTLFGFATLIIFSLWVTLLYWTKQRSFPLAFLILSALALVSTIADAAGASALGVTAEGPSPDATPLRGTVGGILWSVYVAVSRRVRSTFLPPPELLAIDAVDAVVAVEPPESAAVLAIDAVEPGDEPPEPEADVRERGEAVDPSEVAEEPAVARQHLP